MKTKIFNPPYLQETVNYCVKQLKLGNVGVFPTDTVYGIGCDSLNANAIKSLYKIKERNLNKPINILVSNIEMVKKSVKGINPIEQKLIDNFWPGSLTIVFNKSNIVPDILTSNLDTIGIRMPNNKICLDIIETLGHPLAMSSANIADMPPDTNLENLLIDFNNKVDFIINSDKDINNMPSTIIKVENNEIKLIREGSISIDEIHKCLGGN